LAIGQEARGGLKVGPHLTPPQGSELKGCSEVAPVESEDALINGPSRWSLLSGAHVGAAGSTPPNELTAVQ